MVVQQFEKIVRKFEESLITVENSYDPCLRLCSCCLKKAGWDCDANLQKDPILYTKTYGAQVLFQCLPWLFLFQ
jgi:hypothetical protein